MNSKNESVKRKEEEEEEEDYMSNDFLNQIEDKRPGLVWNRSTARKYEVEKKSKQKIEENNLKVLQLSSKALEKVNRDEALSKSTLDETNKGFSMMLKMGYKKGQGLGNEASTVAKLIEPISVEIKTDRAGLGQGEERKRKLNEYVKSKDGKVQSDKDISDAYLEHKRHRFLIKKLRGNLFKCQKICYQLDSTVKNIKKPIIAKWFWPHNIIRELYKKEEIEAETIHLALIKEAEVESKTEIQTNVSNKPIEEFKPKQTVETIDLKAVYNERLDIFLQTKNEESEVNQTTNNEHTDEDDENKLAICCDINKEKENSDTEPVEEEEEEEGLTEELITKRIETICAYLRENYFYCVWCGARYESIDDLVNNCPGLSQNEHEDYE